MQKNVKMAVFARIRIVSVCMDMVGIDAKGQVMQIYFFVNVVV